MKMTECDDDDDADTNKRILNLFFSVQSATVNQ